MKVTLCFTSQPQQPRGPHNNSKLTRAVCLFIFDHWCAHLKIHVIVSEGFWFLFFLVAETLLLSPWGWKLIGRQRTSVEIRISYRGQNRHGIEKVMTSFLHKLANQIIHISKAKHLTFLAKGLYTFELQLHLRGSDYRKSRLIYLHFALLNKGFQKSDPGSSLFLIAWIRISLCIHPGSIFTSP